MFRLLPQVLLFDFCLRPKRTVRLSSTSWRPTGNRQQDEEEQQQQVHARSPTQVACRKFELAVEKWKPRVVASSCGPPSNRCEACASLVLRDGVASRQGVGRAGQGSTGQGNLPPMQVVYLVLKQKQLYCLIYFVIACSLQSLLHYASVCMCVCELVCESPLHVGA